MDALLTHWPFVLAMVSINLGLLTFGICAGISVGKQNIDAERADAFLAGMEYERRNGRTES